MILIKYDNVSDKSNETFFKYCINRNVKEMKIFKGKNTIFFKSISINYNVSVEWVTDIVILSNNTDRSEGYSTSNTKLN
jgi:hypothetical protein